MTQQERRTLAHVVWLDCVRERIESSGGIALHVKETVEVELMNLEAERYSYEDIFQFPSERA